MRRTLKEGMELVFSSTSQLRMAHSLARFRSLGQGGAAIIIKAIRQGDIDAKAHQVAGGEFIRAIPDRSHVANISDVEIEISNGSLGDKVGEFIHAVAENRNIVGLRLHGASLTDGDFKIVSEVLARNKSLLSLSISGSQIGDEGSKHLADFIAKNVFLERCEISQSSTSESGRAILTNGYEQNTSIVRGYLPQEILERNRFIESVVFDYTRPVAAKLLRSVNSSPDSLFFMTRFVMSDLTSSFVRVAKRGPFDKLSNDDFQKLARHWEGPLCITSRAKIGNYGEEKWPPMLGVDAIKIPKAVTKEEGWKIIELTTPSQVKAEGEAMQHCINGYVGRALMGNSHLFSIVNGKGERVSTFELERHPYRPDSVKDDFLTIKHSGFRDSVPPAESIDALEWLVNNVRSGKVTIDHKFLHESCQKRVVEENTLQGGATKFLGFNPFDESKLKEVERAYVHTIIPPELRGKYREFLRTERVELDGGLTLGTGSTSFVINKKDHPLEVSRKTAALSIQGRLDKIFGEDRVEFLISEFDDVTKVSKVMIVPKDLSVSLEPLADFIRELKREDIVAEEDATIDGVDIGAIAFSCKLNSLKSAMEKFDKARKKSNSERAAPAASIVGLTAKPEPLQLSQTTSYSSSIT